METECVALVATERQINMWRLIYFIPTYIAFSLFRFLMSIIGWVLIPPMALLAPWSTKHQESKINGRIITVWRFWFMYPWSNDEDGIYAGEELVRYPSWIRATYWTAWRNPVNNLRFVKYLRCGIDKNKIKFVGSSINLESIDFIARYGDLRHYDQDKNTFWYLCWQGVYSNFRWQFKLRGNIYRFWIGWKIYPHDRYGLESWDYRRFGAGFATQAKRCWIAGQV